MQRSEDVTVGCACTGGTNSLRCEMALAAALHHSRDVGPVTYNALRSQKTARAWEEEENEMHFATGQTTSSSQSCRPAEYYPSTPGAEAGGVLAADGPAVASRRGAAAGAGSAAHRGSDRRCCPSGASSRRPLCRRWVEQLPNLVQFFAALSPVPEQVIAVPKILPHEVLPRRLCRDTQLAEQLVEVPTILYFLKQRIPEQIDDNPVPHGGRGASGGPSRLSP